MNRIGAHQAACLGAAIVAGALVMAPTADAAILMTDPGAGSPRDNWNGMVGYSFTVNTSGLSVTSLGVYDIPGNGIITDVDEVGDGLVQDAIVGLYTDSGTLIASTTVPSGTAGTLLHGFRYMDLTEAVELTAGATYRFVMGVNSNGTGFLNRLDSPTGNPTFSDDVTYGAEWYSTSGDHDTLAFPTSSSGFSRPFVGPNFQYVPEPASLALLALGGVMVAGRGRQSAG